MGFFQTLYESGEKRWNMPKEEDIAGCKVAAIDPYFIEATQEHLADSLCHGVRRCHDIVRHAEEFPGGRIPSFHENTPGPCLLHRVQWHSHESDDRRPIHLHHSFKQHVQGRVHPPGV